MVDQHGKRSESPKLALLDVSKAFGRVQAVREVSLNVDAGEIIVLLGPSGCGKTTLLSIIAGLLRPSKGSVLVDGADITRLPPNKRRMGVVFQSYALFPHLNVYNNIVFGLKSHRIDKGEQERRYSRAVAMLGIEELRERFPRELSGGQQQRVAVARALVLEPQVVLLDEPFSNLDAKVRDTMRVELADFFREIGATVIMVTHDQADAAYLSDRVLVIRDGEVVQVGAFESLYREPANAFVANFLSEGTWHSGRIVEDLEGAPSRALIDCLGATMPMRVPTRLKPGSAVDVLIRRDALEAIVSLDEARSRMEASTDMGVLTGHVRNVVRLGPQALIWFETEGERVVLHVPASPNLSDLQNQEVGALVRPDECYAFEATGQHEQVEEVDHGAVLPSRT